ncbi:hypothetical protein EGK75_13485 [Neisseria weixii]|uniref:Holin n=1 Tax=Neisseria weixii TaxID=1853276 RepID=A0A3N4MTX9_9NEIS|nr:holin [Neisseria weixii]RPD83130.1 hypothetical protein EGK74_13405 [Neisseria weixii]RPD83280.1 hypothetical protein EGK75_13485 [Neisseria weixii]
MKNLEAPVTTASDIASRYTYGGAGAGAVGAWLHIDWAMWVGILVAVGGFVVNVFFKIREDRRQAEWHRLQAKMLKEKQDEQ